MAAARVGLKSILVLTGSGRADVFSSKPDFVVEDFPAAVNFILQGYPAIAAAVAELLDELEGPGHR